MRKRTTKRHFDESYLPAVKNLIAEGFNNKEIAARLNKCHRALGYFIQDHNLKPVSPKNRMPKDIYIPFSGDKVMQSVRYEDL